MECRNPLAEIQIPPLYLEAAANYLDEQKTGKMSKNLEIFKTKCLMKKIENLRDFVEVQLHTNFFTWATESVFFKNLYFLIIFSYY